MRIDLIEKIEGEAYLEWRKGRPFIRFESSRGVEAILRGRPAWDALVIAPRVCGICGHAHLAAAAAALESAIGIEPTQKARSIRRITRYAEMVQNHIKWLYLQILPHLGKSDYLAVHPAVTAASSLIAIFAGQWPHSSYMIPGGVTCDPSALEILRAKSHLAAIQSHYEGRILPDLAALLERLAELGIADLGRAYDRFLILEEGLKLRGTRPSGAKTQKIRLYEQPGSAALGAKYGERHYETGPLGRGLLRRDEAVRRLHRRHLDGLAARIGARGYEIGALLKKMEALLDGLDLGEPSAIKAPREFAGEGEGVVEAARGSLVHRIVVERGRITSYTIITPTQFNLANGDTEPGPAVRALSHSPRKWSELIFRSFDVCSVCTTH